MKFQGDSAQIFAHRANVARYRRMLTGRLTPVERDFIERRLTEENEALRKIAESFASENMNTG